MDKTIKKIQLLFSITLLIKILGLLYKMLLTRFLKIDGMVIYSLLMPTLSLSIALSSFNIQTVCNQNISQNSNSVRNILKSALKINIITSSIVSIIILLLFPFAKAIYGSYIIYYPLLTIIPLIYFSNFSGIMKGYLEAKKNFITPALSNLLEQIAKIMLSISFIFLVKSKDIYMKVIMAFLAMSLSEIFSFSFLIYKLTRNNKIYWSRTLDSNKKLLFKQAAPITIDHLIISIITFFEPIIFFYFCNINNISKDISTKIYALTNQYAIPALTMILFIPLTISKIIFPEAAKSINNLNAIQKKIDLAIIVIFVCSLFNFNLCRFHNEKILLFLYKDISCKNLTILLTYFFILIYFSPLLVGILQAQKKEFFLLIESIILNILSICILISFTFIKEINFLAYPLSIAITSSLKVTINFIYIKVRLNYSFPLFGTFVLFLSLFLNIFIESKIKASSFSLVYANLVSLMVIVFYYYLLNKRKPELYHMKHK